jgi:type II secretory pathway component PulJ
MRIHRLHTTGYTLIELLLYIAITSSLLVVAVGFFGMVSESRIKGQAVAEVDQQAAYVMDYMTSAVRNAASLSVPAAAASGSTLTVTSPASTTSVFSLSGTTLQVKEGSAAVVSLSNSNVAVSNLTFTNLTRFGSNGIVRISFTVARTNTAGRQEYNYQQTYTNSAEVRW